MDDEDPTGAGGMPFLEAASWWLIAAGVMLLLPRQWVSAGIALLLAGVVRLWHRSKMRRAR